MVDGTLSQASLDVIAAAQASYRKFQAKRGPPVSVSLGQYALESDWGRKLTGTFNFFGIKANKAQIAAGQFTEKMTHEQLPDGALVAEPQRFANYASIQDAFDAHATLLTSPHYIDCQNAQTVEDYCRALQADGYATAHNYATALFKTINDNRLTQFDLPPWGNADTAPAGLPASAAGGGGGPDPAAGATQGPPMANTTQPVVPAAPAPTPALPPATPPTPVAAPPIVIDYGDIIDQILTVLTPVFDQAASAGLKLATNAIPGGALILDFLGPNMVSQFVGSAVGSVESLLKSKSLSISPTNALETMVLSAIQTELPGVASFLSVELPAWISAEVAKVTPSLAAASPAAAAPAPAAAPGTAKT
jgi:Mannosyl-glycoprotein endo-beta-N-acetylglucosaminidase